MNRKEERETQNRQGGTTLGKCERASLRSGVNGGITQERKKKREINGEHHSAIMYLARSLHHHRKIHSKLRAALRARVVVTQPLRKTGMMRNVATAERRHHLTDCKIVHTYGAATQLSSLDLLTCQSLGSRSNSIIRLVQAAVTLLSPAPPPPN